MADLPVVSGRDVVQAFERAGWFVTRQRGSHVIMTKPHSIVTLSVPQDREVARGTLRALIRSAGLTVGEFTRFLRD